MVLSVITLTLTVTVFFSEIAHVSPQECAYTNGTSQTLTFTGGSMSGFYSLGTKFLDALHQNSIPYDSIKALIDFFSADDPQTTEFWPKIQPIVRNQAGLIACVVLGILFIIITPIVGLVFCCCRLCDNCGGKRVQRKPTNACCGVLLGATLLIFVFVLTGIILYSKSSSSVYTNVELAGDGIVEQGANLVDFLVQTAQEVSCEVNLALQRALVDASSILPSMATQLIGSLKNQTVVAPLISLTTTLPAIQNQWLLVNQSLNDFLGSEALLKTEFEQLAQNVANNYPNPPLNRSGQLLVLNELKRFRDNVSNLQDKLTPNISMVNNTAVAISQNISDIQQLLNSAQQALNTDAQQLLSELNSANETVTQALQQLNSLIADVKTQISNFTTDFVQYSKKEANNFLNDYGWVRYVGVILIIPIISATLCMFIGLMLGMTGYKRHVHPSKRSSISNAGGNFLIIAVALMFIFGWIYMMFTTAFFIVGYSLQYVCTPVFQDPELQLYSYIGEWYTNDIVIDTDYGQLTYSLNLEKAISGCKQDNTAYSALTLDQVIGPLLNNGSVQIQQALKDIPLTKFTNEITDNLVFQLPSSLNSSLQNLQISLQKISSLWTSAEFQCLFAPANATKTALVIYANFSISNHDDNLAAEVNQVEQQLHYFEKNQSNALTLIQQYLQLLTASESYITKAQQFNSSKGHIVQIVQDQAAGLFQQINQTSLQFISSITNALENNVAHCGPIYTTWENLGVILCQELGYPVHGTWLGLGWCLVFFIPAIIVCVRLAKYFRRMRPVYTTDYNDMTAITASFGDSLGNSAPMTDLPVPAPRSSVPVVKNQLAYNPYQKNELWKSSASTYAMDDHF